MAKLKKTARSAKASATAPKLNLKADLLPKSLADSAQQIWMAGMGAFQRAQTEGSKLFDALVKEGSTFEAATRKLATGRVDAVRDAVEERVGSVRERATDTWDRLEKVFEERVQRALTRLGVPGREDLADLVARVDELNKQLRALSKAPAAAKPTTKAATKASVPKKPAAKKAPAVKKPAAKKAKALPTAPTPSAP
jgi:poly(hydroxyalkanoate) granule-associated protein